MGKPDEGRANVCRITGRSAVAGGRGEWSSQGGGRVWGCKSDSLASNQLIRNQFFKCGDGRHRLMEGDRTRPPTLSTDWKRELKNVAH